MEKQEFTVEDGITIQTEQLERWKAVLLPEVYTALEEYTTRDNNKAKSGYDICRGTDITTYISSYTFGNRL